MNALFAPDYTKDNPYQKLLADALSRQAVDVSFLDFFKRGLPLARSIKLLKPSVLHLHWPEAYFSRRNDGLDLLRKLRFPFDLKLSGDKVPIVYTAHNLIPHNSNSYLIIRNMASICSSADAVITHSDSCRDYILRNSKVSKDRCYVIPHGDLSVTFGEPVDRESARKSLGLGDEPVCLMFGVISRYKGIDDAIRWWREKKPKGQLVIAGPVFDKNFKNELELLTRGTPDITMKASRLSDDDLKLWLCASDCALFNYRQVFTSGAACLARSFGLPVMLPDRLTTVDLDEPSPLVIRFRDLDELPEKMAVLLRRSPGWAAAADWRKKTSWESVAAETADIYRKVLK